MLASSVFNVALTPTSWQQAQQQKQRYSHILVAVMNTLFMYAFKAALTALPALSVQLWVERITQTWVHCSKFTGRSIRARNLADSFVHIQQHLLQENAALRQSLEQLTKQQTSQQLDLSNR